MSLWNLCKTIRWKGIVLTLSLLCHLSWASDDRLTWVPGEFNEKIAELIPEPLPHPEFSIKNASRGMTFLSLQSNTAVIVSNIGQCNAKGASSSVPAGEHACLHLFSSKGGPRVHSEIAYLQQLTGSENPIGSEVIARDYTLKDLQGMDIYIKNVPYPPCSMWNSSGDLGIPCWEYLINFCKAMKEKGVDCHVFVGYKSQMEIIYKWIMYHNDRFGLIVNKSNPINNDLSYSE